MSSVNVHRLFEKFRIGSKSEVLWIFPLFLIFCILTLTAEILSYFNGTSAISMIADYGWKALRLLPLVACVGIALQLALAVIRQPKDPLQLVIRQWRDALADPYMLAARLVPVLLMPFFFASFSVLKMLMPRYVPFWLDEWFAAADRIAFFGHQPWEFTHWLFPGIEATQTFDQLYSIWVLLLSAAIGGFALFAPRLERARFFLSFGSAWFFLGFIGAWLGSSAGPCFLANLHSPIAPEFAGLMTRLKAASDPADIIAQALEWQDMLWRGYETRTYAFGMGISAMPSLHNAISALYVFLGFRFGRLAGLVASAYFAAIFVGSIHLGWHYAVDGVIAVIFMAIIWKAVDRWCVLSGYDDAVKACAATPQDDSSAGSRQTGLARH